MCWGVREVRVSTVVHIMREVMVVERFDLLLVAPSRSMAHYRRTVVMELPVGQVVDRVAASGSPRMFLAGSGVIQSNGGIGSGDYPGGGGSGGRVAVYYTTSTMPLDAAQLQAFGGSGQQYGGAGTVFCNRVVAIYAGHCW